MTAWSELCLKNKSCTERLEGTTTKCKQWVLRSDRIMNAGYLLFPYPLVSLYFPKCVSKQRAMVSEEEGEEFVFYKIRKKE